MARKIVVANVLLRQARLACPSPWRAGHHLSRSELATAVNDLLHRNGVLDVDIDAGYVGKLEAGRYRWPRSPHRRWALRTVLGAVSDEDLGFYPTRASRGDGTIPVPPDGVAASSTNTAEVPAGDLVPGSATLSGLTGSAAGAADDVDASVDAHLVELVSVLDHRGLGAAAQGSLLPDTVRAAVLAPDAADMPAGDALPRLRDVGARAHGHYQRAEYDHAAALIPELMTAAASVTPGHGVDRREADIAVACAHLAVSKLALKLGDAQLGWVAADRAHSRAVEADHPALRAVTMFAIGCALLATPGRERDAADVVDHSLTGTRRHPPRRPAEISATGALLLLAALVATRNHDPGQATAHLRAADALANRLGGDRNDLWTGFGPTNVLIHRVGIAAGTDPDRAITLGQQLDTSHLHPALLSRRSQVHLDLADAFTHRPGGDASAELHLLQVEHLAPQMIRVHPPARDLIARLLGRERRAATPGLRDLARRAGLLASA